jgi:hypothetical protein
MTKKHLIRFRFKVEYSFHLSYHDWLVFNANFCSISAISLTIMFYTGNMVIIRKRIKCFFVMDLTAFEKTAKSEDVKRVIRDRILEKWSTAKWKKKIPTPHPQRKWLPYICSCVRRGHLLENLSSICRLEFNPPDVYSIQLYTEKTLLVAYTRYGEDVGWGFFFFILPSIIFPIYGLWLPFWHLQTFFLLL